MVRIGQGSDERESHAGTIGCFRPRSAVIEHEVADDSTAQGVENDLFALVVEAAGIGAENARGRHKGAITDVEGGEVFDEERPFARGENLISHRHRGDTGSKAHTREVYTG